MIPAILGIILTSTAVFLAPGVAVDWEGTQYYKELQGECGKAIEAGTVWWFIPSDRGGPYIPPDHLWDPQLTFGYELKAICLAYPTLSYAERAGLLASQVPQGVPALNPKNEWPKARKAAIEWLLENQDSSGGWGPGWSYRGVTINQPDTSDTAGAVITLISEIDRRYRSGDDYYDLVEPVRKGILWLLNNQRSDGGWGSSKSDSSSSTWHTQSAIAALLRALGHRYLLLLDDQTTEQIKKAIEQGVSWLLNHQNQDGSWCSGVMGEEYTPDTQSYVISVLIDVYKNADRLKLNVNKGNVLDAIRKGIAWLFSNNAAITWVKVGQSEGPAWAYAVKYLQAQGSPETTVTGNVLYLALLKALWYDVATDTTISTPGGPRKLSDLLTDPNYNLHTTIEWLLSQQNKEVNPDHPEWYGAWPWPARGVTNTVEGAKPQEASIWATAYAMRALEAYLHPNLFYTPVVVDPIKAISTYLVKATKNLNNKISTLESNMNKLENNLLSIEQNIASMKQSIDQLNSNISELENKVNSAASKVENLESSISGLENHIAKLEERVSNLENKSTNVDNLTKTIQNIQSNLESLSSEVNNIKEEIENIRSEISNKTSNPEVAEKIKIIENNLKNLSNSLENLSEKVAQLEDQIKKIEGEINNSNAASEVKNLENRIAKLEERVSNLENKSANVDNLAKTIQNIQCNIKSLNEKVNSLESLSSEVNNIKEEIENIRSELSKLSSSRGIESVESVENNLKNLSNSLKNLSEKVAQLEDQIKKIGNLESLSYEVNNVKKDVGNLRKIIESIRSEISNKTSNPEVAEKIKIIENNLKNLSNSLENLSEKVAQLEDQIKGLKREKESINTTTIKSMVKKQESKAPISLTVVLIGIISVIMARRRR